MNQVILMGRLTKDPDDRTSVVRYTLAVDRRYKKDGEAAADFIQCKAFGKTGEFAAKYFRKGTKVIITGRIETGSYTDKDGNKVFTTDVIAENQEFCESKKQEEKTEEYPF